MEFVILTGMSGAGKSSALKMMEDMDYLCVDNLPIQLILKFAKLANTNPDDEQTKVALGIDVRSGKSLPELENVLERLSDEKITYKILFLDADDGTLVKRYKETRRKHPLAGQNPIEVGIIKERKKMNFLKEQADYIIDTSKLLTRDLNRELKKIFLDKQPYKSLFVSVVSFGFKYGIPEDADLVFDVRFLPNPFYVEDLKQKTGQDQEVRDYVMQSEDAKIFLEKLKDMITFLMPRYVAEGKNQLVIAVGCTGGKHRSVTIANALYEALKDDPEYGLRIDHRDITKGK
jgi:RNase adapter protein RapZ